VKLWRSGEFETLLMEKIFSIEECVSRYMEFNLVFKRGMEVLGIICKKKVPKLKPQTGTLNKVGIAEFSYKYHIYRGCILPTYIIYIY
jgi:hypothetical protein